MKKLSGVFIYFNVRYENDLRFYLLSTVLAQFLFVFFTLFFLSLCLSHNLGIYCPLDIIFFFFFITCCFKCIYKIQVPERQVSEFHWCKERIQNGVINNFLRGIILILVFFSFVFYLFSLLSFLFFLLLSFLFCCDRYILVWCIMQIDISFFTIHFFFFKILIENFLTFFFDENFRLCSI